MGSSCSHYYIKEISPYSRDLTLTFNTYENPKQPKINTIMKQVNFRILNQLIKHRSECVVFG